MITIQTSDNCLIEKEYIFNTLFNNFLGISYNMIIDNSQSSYKFILENGNVLQIKDHFFSKLKNENIFEQNNIPKEVFKSTISELDNLPVVCLYGSLKISVEKDIISIDNDFIAATFFMLTRWEEAVIPVRDKFGRFPASESLAVKHNFIDRPIVNEYLELLWKCIKLLDPSAKRSPKKFNFLLTHDVDLPKLWWNPKDFIKTIGGALVKRKDIKEAMTLSKQYITRKDPFYIFDWMMDVSEKYSVTSHFFFMSGGTSNKDNYYKIDHPIIKALIQTIKDRNHKVGFHPSFNAYNDQKQFVKELDLLKKESQVNITTGRHHFLRFEVPTTWQIWEDCGMEWDSTLSFHDKEGYRCGVCYPFPVFNILTRKQLNLIERPLTVMEGSFMTYQKITPELMLTRIKKLMDTTKLYNGEFVFLWHNSAFRDPSFNPVYEEVLKYATNES